MQSVTDRLDSVNRMSGAGDTTRTRQRTRASSFAPLRVRNFRLFWISGIVSNTGRWFQAVAVPIIVLDITGSAGWVGIAGFAQLLPTALMGPLAGAIADRYPRRRVLLITQSVQALLAFGFMAMWITGIRSVGAYVAASVVAGVAGGLNLPAWQAFVSELVPRDQLMGAITLNSAQFNAARMIGPAMAGVMIAAIGPAWAFGINGVSYAAVLVALTMMRLTPLPVDRSSPMRPVREFVETLAYIRQRPGIVTAILAVSLIGMFGLSVQTLSVVMAEDVFHRGGGGFGLMLSMVGMGAVLSSPFITQMAGRVRRSRVQGTALVLYGMSISLLAVAPWFGLALVAMMMMGAAHIASASTLNTAIQLQVDERVRAKVLSVYLTSLLLANPIGQLVLGQLIERFGARRSFGGAAAAMLAMAAILMASGRMSSLDDDLGTDDPMGSHMSGQ